MRRVMLVDIMIEQFSALKIVNACKLVLAFVISCLLAWACGGSGNSEGGTSTTHVAQITTAVPVITASGVPDGEGGSGLRRQVDVVSSRLALGERHGCVLVGGGEVGCWGANGFGELGLGQVSGVEEYGSSVVGISDAVSVAVGGSHSCTLVGDGGVLCWGSNATGQLGDGSDAEFRAMPVRVAGVEDAIAIDTGGDWRNERTIGHSCAVHADGTVSCWGNHWSGQLGIGEIENVDSSLPSVKVVGISDAIDIVAGETHSCALRVGGAVSCWGNDSKVRGDDIGIADNSRVPVDVVGISGAIVISAGRSVTCAVIEGGEAWCWGENHVGQLGNGTTNSSFVPVRVSGIRDAVSVSVGVRHACALHKGGEISCWGHNEFGALGSLPEVMSELPDPSEFLELSDYKASMPVKVVGVSDAVEVEAELAYSCALHSDDSVSCWGSNLHGQLGRYPQNGATDVVGIDDAVEVSVSKHYSCARHLDSAVSCWGHNNRGQLGNGTRRSSTVPEKIADIDDAVTIVTENFSGRNGFACALLESGSISCWGSNSFGNLGNGLSSGDEEDTSADALVPVKVSGISDAVELDISWNYACAVHEDRRVSCWGTNNSGYLENGQSSGDAEDISTGSSVPVSVVDLFDVSEIELGARHSCGLDVDGRVSCWGNNTIGNLGNGQEPSDDVDEVVYSAVPVEAVGISNVVSVSAATFSTCALLEDASLSCWGWNLRSQLGRNSSDAFIISEPTKLEGISGIVSVASSESEDIVSVSKCALLETGEVYCLGANTYGKLGNGQLVFDRRDTESDSAIPTKVQGITDVTAITAGSDHYCVLVSDGRVWCWGSNLSGQLGIYSYLDWLVASGEPVQVPNVSDAISISSSHNHTCAVIAGGSVKCWGNNLFGQLGNGYADYLPTKVPGLNIAG